MYVESVLDYASNQSEAV